MAFLVGTVSLVVYRMVSKEHAKSNLFLSAFRSGCSSQILLQHYTFTDPGPSHGNSQLPHPQQPPSAQCLRLIIVGHSDLHLLTPISKPNKGNAYFGDTFATRARQGSLWNCIWAYISEWYLMVCIGERRGRETHTLIGLHYTTVSTWILEGLYLNSPFRKRIQTAMRYTLWPKLAIQPREAKATPG